MLVIGAGFLQDFVICKSREMGYLTLAVDGDANAVGFQHTDKYAVINIVDEQACLEYARENEIDGVLTAATDYGVLTAAYVAREMGLPGLDYEVAKLIKNKYGVRKCLFENKVDDTQLACEVHESTDIDALKSSLTFPVMVKPCDGSGSRGASRVDRADDLEKACHMAMDSSITHRAEIEAFVFGKEYGAESLVVNGEIHVLGIMKKWMTEPPYYAELGHAIPCGLNSELEEKAKKCVENAIKALGINSGSVNMDMIISDKGDVHIVDIGARMGGNMIGPCIIPYGTGIDYMAAMIQNAVGDPVELSVKNKTAVCTRLLAFDDGYIAALPDFDEFEKRFKAEAYHHMSVGMKVNEYHTNLDGCGYFVSRSESAEDAEKNVEAALDYFKKNYFCPGE